MTRASEKIKDLENELVAEKGSRDYWKRDSDKLYRELIELKAKFAELESLKKPATITTSESVNAKVNSFITGGLITSSADRFREANKRQETLLEDILTLEPQMKHYGDNGSLGDGKFRWDFDRVHRAAEHLRNIDAAASVGYTDHSPDNVTHLHIIHTDPAA